MESIGRSYPTGGCTIGSQVESPERLLEQLLDLEGKLEADIARKPKHQKPQLQAIWRDMTVAINKRLS